MLKSHEISHGYDFPRYWDHSTVNIFQSDHHFLVYQAPLESPCSWFQVTGIPPAWTRVLLKKRIVLFPRSPPHLHFQKLQGPQIVCCYWCFYWDVYLLLSTNPCGLEMPIPSSFYTSNEILKWKKSVLLGPLQKWTAICESRNFYHLF